MIQSIRIKDFRNFSLREISFWSEKNLIIGNNGKGKSNILEALSLPSNPLMESKPEYLLKKWSEVFYVWYDLLSGKVSCSYDGALKKKKYTIGDKNTTKAKLKASYPHVISFHPMMMNMMYLSPSQRRDFLDWVTSSSFLEYEKKLSHYKKVLSNRNKILKNISEWKSQISELQFWNDSFIRSADEIYKYRKHIIDYYKKEVPYLQQYFFWKVEKVDFLYESKIDISCPRQELEEYISQNIQKEILLRKTLRWPHLDDFDIIVDGTPLIHYASRWEVKSILLGLKFLETKFIQKHSEKQEILFLIDDLLSELDTMHRDILWEHIWTRQCIISSIEDIELEANKIYI